MVAAQRGSRSGRSLISSRDWAGHPRRKVIEVAAAVIAPGRLVPARPASDGQGVRGLLGIPRRQGRAPRRWHRRSPRAARGAGIDIGACYPWITRVFTYPHGTVGSTSSGSTGGRRAAPARGPGDRLAGRRHAMASPMLPASAGARLARAAQSSTRSRMLRATASRRCLPAEARLRRMQLLQVRDPAESSRKGSLPARRSASRSATDAR